MVLVSDGSAGVGNTLTNLRVGDIVTVEIEDCVVTEIFSDAGFNGANVDVRTPDGDHLTTSSSNIVYQKSGMRPGQVWRYEGKKVFIWKSSSRGTKDGSINAVDEDGTERSVSFLTAHLDDLELLLDA